MDREVRGCSAEEAVAGLRLFERDLLPGITHTMCPDCYDRVTAPLDRLGQRAGRSGPR